VVKRFVLLVVAIGAFAVAGQAAAQAITETTVETFKFTDHVASNPCNGETVVFEGTTTLVSQLVFDPTGGVHAIRNTATAATGVGETTGVAYTLSTNSQFQTNAVAPNGAYEYHDASGGQVVSGGPGPNWWIAVFSKVTLTPSGNFVQFSFGESECRGAGRPTPLP
jgi:hypothetical protein